jgi:hypothetical protein
MQNSALAQSIFILYDKVKEAKDKVSKPKDKLREIALAYLDFSEENRSYFDIINYFLSSPEVIFPPHLKSRIDLHGNRILSLVEKTVEDIGSVKEMSEGAVKKYALILWSGLHGMLQLRKLQNTILKDQNFKELYLLSAMLTINSIGKKHGNDL